MTARWTFSVVAALAVAGSLLVGAPAALAANVGPEVVNGRQPTPGEARSLVYVSAGGYSCGGTLVDATHVVTAGHCSVDDNGRTFRPTDVKIKWAASTSYDNLRPYSVESVTTHPQYNPKTFDNDIAVLTLAQPLAGATPTPIATVAESAEALKAGNPVRSAGYGLLNFDGRPSNILQVADLTAMSDEVCGSWSESEVIDGVTFYGADVNTAHFACAIGVVPGSNKIIDTCQGDSGGPLYSAATTPVLVGVVSSGYGCAGVDEGGTMSKKRPGIYTRVSAYRDWLMSAGVDLDSGQASAPRIVSVVPGADSLMVVVAPGDSTDFDNYQLFVVNTADDNDSWYCTVPKEEDSCLFPGLQPGAEYAVTVQYEGSEDVSEPTYVTVGEPVTTEPPVRPKITKGFDQGAGRVKLKVRVGDQPEGTKVWVRCTSKILKKNATVKNGWANLRLNEGANYTCRAYAQNDAGRAASSKFRFRL